MKDKHFEHLREGIRKELLRTNRSFNIYWGFRDSPPDVSRVMDMYLHFFVPTLYAHHNEFVISIYNLTKCNRDTSNFPRLLNYLEGNGHFAKLYAEEIIKGRNILLSYENLLDILWTDRDKIVAHNELKKSDWQIKLSYQRSDAQNLIDELCGLFNNISGKYDDISYGFITCPPEHLINILRDLNQFYINREHK